MPFGPLATAGGGGGAPDDAQYVVMVANATLTQERVLTGTANQITITDAGAGAAVTLALPQNYDTAATPTLGGLTLNGALLVRSQNEVRWYDNGNYVGFEAGALGADQIWVLPTADGGVNEFLQTDGGGNLAWAAAGGGAPGGANKQVQYNNAAAFGGATGFEWQNASPNVLISAQNAAHVPLVIRAAAAQTEVLLYLQNSAGAELLRLDADDNSNVFLGRLAGRVNNLAGGSAGKNNTFLGSVCGYSNTTGFQNTAVGFEALRNNQTGTGNVALGYKALRAHTGSNSFGLGYEALLASTTGGQNLGLGNFALRALTTQDFNTAVGNNALRDTTGDRNTGAGNATLRYTTGSYNAALGMFSGQGTSGTSTFSYCTLAGYEAGYALTTGDNNTLVGYEAGEDLTTGAGNVFLGYNAGKDQETTNSNRLYIANTNTATPLIYGEFANHIFRNYASTAVTAAVQVGVHRLAHVTSGVAAPLFGISATHELEDGGGVLQTASEDATLWAVATAGSEQPLRRWTNYPNGAAGPGYGGYITADDVDNVALTIIPNGAGDVTVGLEVVYFVSVSDGNTAGGNATCLNGGNVTLYNAGGNTLTLAVAADGSATLQRTADAGAGLTYDCSLWLVWV